jgi:hypothetical protein
MRRRFVGINEMLPPWYYGAVRTSWQGGTWYAPIWEVPFWRAVHKLQDWWNRKRSKPMSCELIAARRYRGLEKAVYEDGIAQGRRSERADRQLDEMLQEALPLLGIPQALLDEGYPEEVRSGYTRKQIESTVQGDLRRLGLKR